MAERFFRGLSGFFRRRGDVPLVDSAHETDPGLRPEPTHSEFVGKQPIDEPNTRRDSEILEDKEPEPQPVGYFMVVADDDPSYRALIGEQGEIVCSPLGSYRVEQATGVTELFTQSLMGNAGKPAQSVLLDNDYSYNRALWTPRYEEISGIAQQLDIDFTPYRNIATASSLWNPNATNYSMLLRALGFNGKIVVLSSAPPDAQDITKAHAALQKAIPIHPQRYPIDGVINVNKRAGSVNYWATERVTEPGMFMGRWKTHNGFEIDDNSLAAVLKQML